MKYFKDRNGVVFSFDGDGSQDSLISSDMTEMSQQEIAEHLSTPPPTRADIEALRQISYADPITGSDRFFAEAARAEAMGEPVDEVSRLKAAGVARAREIADMYPWPV